MKVYLYKKNNLIIILSQIFLISVANIAFATTGSEINTKLKTWLLTKNIVSNPTFSSNKKFKKCSSKIQFKQISKNFSLIKVVCPDQFGWKVYVKPNVVKSNEVSKFVKNLTYKVISLKFSHEKGDIITSNSLDISFGNKRNSFYSEPNQLIGRKLKQNLKKGQIINPRHLYKKFDINEGDPVLIVSSIGKTTVSSSGIAIKSGNLDDLLEVKNKRSGKIVKGYVKKNKIIQVYH